MELTWALTTRGLGDQGLEHRPRLRRPDGHLKSLWAQRRKWDEGMIRLLLGTKLGAATVYPWRMQLKMGLNALVARLFVVLLATSLAVHAYEWNWIWIIPPVLGALLNLKHARKVPGRTRLGLCSPCARRRRALPRFRLCVWAASWATVIMGIRRDGWARQYKAEGLPRPDPDRAGGGGLTCATP